MEEQTATSIWGGMDIALIIVAAIIVLIVLYFQIISFNETRKKIQELISFFPNINSISIFKSSIKKSDIESTQALQKFIESPRKRVEAIEMLEDESEDEEDKFEDDDASFEVQRDEYTDVDILKAQSGSEPFKEVISETNSYLCKNVGTSADFAILEDICNSKIDAIETEIQTLSTFLCISALVVPLLVSSSVWLALCSILTHYLVLVPQPLQHLLCATSCLELL